MSKAANTTMRMFRTLLLLGRGRWGPDIDEVDGILRLRNRGVNVFPSLLAQHFHSNPNARKVGVGSNEFLRGWRLFGVTP